jgi:hypothetical protein
MIRSYAALPNVPEAGLLTRYMDTLGVVVPLARTNLVLNPLLKNNTTGWTVLNADSTFTSGIPSDFYQNGYGASIQPLNPGVQFGIYYSIALTSGITYVASVMFRRRQATTNGTYAIAFATSGSVDLAVYRFRAAPANVWQKVWVFYTETSSTTRRIIIRRDDTGGVAAGSAFDRFDISGLQVESCADGVLAPTTYIDGDQLGLVPNQYPPAYGWAGTPHASTSYRSGQTRAGGYVVRFRDFGFLLTAIIGLGMAPPDHQALTFAQLDGGQYENTIKPPRQFSTVGRWAGYTPTELDAGQAALGALLDRDLVGQRQPLVLTTQASDCGQPIGQPVQVQAIYQQGLEGNIQELPSAAGAITFTQYLPMVLGGGQAVSLDVQDALTPSGILHRSTSGVWDTLGAGVTGGTATVRAFARGLDGTIYVGGNFTDAGGSGADYIAAYNPVTGTYSTLGGAGSLNGQVNALAVGPDGRIYVGGAFTNGGSIPAADGIAVWDPVATTWAALSTGTAGTIYALVFSPAGVLFAGGSFTSIGTSTADNVAQWNGSAWSNLTSDAAIGAQVNALAWGNGQLYVGGAFDNAGGVAAADRIAAWTSSGGWVALSTGMNNTVDAIAIGLDGTVYAGGLFTTAGGVAALRIAAWSGIQWVPMGAGLDNEVQGLAVAQDGVLFVVGLFTTTGGIPLSGVFARWNGNWIPGDIDLSVNTGVTAVYAAADNSIYIGYVAGGTATAGGSTTATNSGTAYAYPRLFLTGPTAGTGRIVQFVNFTTGAAIYFNLTMSAGEKAVLTLDPKNATFVSTFQGNILNTILPGSQTTAFLLQKGDNTILIYSTSSTVTAALDWQIGYTNLSDAIRRTVP